MIDKNPKINLDSEMKMKNGGSIFEQVIDTSAMSPEELKKYEENRLKLMQILSPLLVKH